MNLKRRLLYVLFGCDVAFFVGVALMCDALHKTRAKSPAYAQIIGYTGFVLLFVFRIYRYYKYVSVTRYYSSLRVHMPQPISEILCMFSATMYSCLTLYLLLIGAYTQTLYELLDTYRFNGFIGSWACACVVNALVSLKHDDRGALRARIKELRLHTMASTLELEENNYPFIPSIPSPTAASFAYKDAIAKAENENSVDTYVVLESSDDSSEELLDKRIKVHKKTIKKKHTS